MKFNEEYDYDYQTVEDWWIGSDEFYDSVSFLFGEQMHEFLTSPDDMPADVKRAVGLFLDWYKAYAYDFMAERYHDYQRELFNDRKLETWLSR